MKFSTLSTAAISLAALPCNAALLSSNSGLQSPLVLEKSSADTFDSSLLKLAAKAMDVDYNSLSLETKFTWSAMSNRFPNVVSSLQFTTKKKTSAAIQAAKSFLGQDSASPKPAFDFHVTDTEFPNYQLRVKKPNPEILNVDSTKQYTGYLDIEDSDKHFFYWFFESRNDPKNDPIVLWLNGGPGCSSLTGLFFELGPSRINADLQPEFNPYSWNNNASVIFLDQPVNVGYSYSSSSSVSSTVSAGKDVHAFLNLFFKQFPEYSHLDFHIAGESYAGHYIPVFATEILDNSDSNNFNLTSVLIGNGLTDPLTQYEYYQPMACGKGGHPQVLSDEECENMLENEPRCLSLIHSCYESESVWSCVPASIYCNNAMFSAYQKTGLNVYDIRSTCEAGGLCYKDLEYIDAYLNQDFVKEALGVDPSVIEKYESCNFEINKNFLFAGDWMKPYHERVIDLLDVYDLPVLIYAGDKDFICNWLGNHGWSDRLPYSNHKQFKNEKLKKFTVSENGKHAGDFKNFEKFTFLRLFDGGHMVPYDQPEASLDFFNRWLDGDYGFKN